eukprot:9517877-Lingulodinium_polyedra.AAC.1
MNRNVGAGRAPRPEAPWSRGARPGTLRARCAQETMPAGPTCIPLCAHARVSQAVSRLASPSALRPSH